MRVLTIGFTKKSAQRFFELLHESGVSRIVDVRLNNGSQLAGFAKKNDLAWFARELCGLEYIHEPSLAPTKETLKDYRNKHMSWSEYESQFIELMCQRQIESWLSQDVLNNGCLLCSEDQPHRCHRRLIAEYLNEHWSNVKIEHLGLAEEIQVGQRIDSDPDAYSRGIRKAGLNLTGRSLARQTRRQLFVADEIRCTWCIHAAKVFMSRKADQ